MTLKTLVTGVAAAAVVGGAAAGVTSIASRRVVGRHRPCSRSCGTSRCRRRPRPTAGSAAADAAGAGRRRLVRRQGTLHPGRHRPDRRPTSPTRTLRKDAAAEGKFPLTVQLANIDPNGPVVTADVTATSAIGATATPERHSSCHGPEPQRLADREGVRSGVALGGRLIHRVHRTRAVVLGAVTIVAALGLSGCSDDTSSAPSPTPVPQSSPRRLHRRRRNRRAAAAAGRADRLDVPARRPRHPAAPTKSAWSSTATPADAAALDVRQGAARQRVRAVDLRGHRSHWSSDQPGNVIANVTISPPQAAEQGLAVPDGVQPAQDSWQLTRQTADLLLE